MPSTPARAAFLPNACGARLAVSTRCSWIVLPISPQKRDRRLIRHVAAEYACETSPERYIAYCLWLKTIAIGGLSHTALSLRCESLRVFAFFRSTREGAKGETNGRNGNNGAQARSSQGEGRDNQQPSNRNAIGGKARPYQEGGQCDHGGSRHHDHQAAQKGRAHPLERSRHPASAKARRAHGPQSRDRRSDQDQGEQKSGVPRRQGTQEVGLIDSSLVKAPNIAGCRFAARTAALIQRSSSVCGSVCCCRDWRLVPHL